MPVPRTSCGFSLVEVMVAITIVSATALAAAGLFSLASTQNRQVRIAKVLMAARNGIDAAINNPVSWNLTLGSSLNPSMRCTREAPGCSVNPEAGSDGFYDFVLLGTNGEKLTYDPGEPSTRLTERGASCPPNVPDPSPLCPIKFAARWKPLCKDPACQFPTVQIYVDLRHDFGPDANLTVNKFNYHYSTFRGVQENTIEAACRSVNGGYNPSTNACLPKHTNRSCVSIGKPYQVVTAVGGDGTIDCSPLYRGTCDADNEVVSGFNADGTVICAPRVCNCAVSWSDWSACSAACGGGTTTRTATLISAPLNGGLACPAMSETLGCNTDPCPVDCVGGWGACDRSCGTGSQTYTVSQPAVGSGASCPFASGDTRACNTQACVPDIDCVGVWGSCSRTCGGGTQTFSISQPASGTGLACPAADGATQACNTQACPVNTDCVGAWSACSQPCGTGSQTYTITQPAAGTGVACPFANGATQACNTQVCPGADVDCVGHWSACNADCGPGVQTFIVTTPKSGNGAACTDNHGDTSPCDNGPCGSGCVPNNGASCTGNQYQEANAAITTCAGACETCDYGVNRCTSAGALFCNEPQPGFTYGLARCWANFDAYGNIDCNGNCVVGGCAEWTGCAGRRWVHQAANCTVSVLSYISPACP